MKLEIGVPDYDWPSGELTGAHLKGRLPHKPVPLLLVMIDVMQDRRKRTPFVRGVPSMVAWDAAKKRVWFFPTPDGEYEFVVPKVKEQPAPAMEMVKSRGPLAAVADRIKGTLHVPHSKKASG